MTTTLFMNGRSQAVRLPKEFRLPGQKVSLRRVGDGVLLEPVKEPVWPVDYFKKITIADEGFVRPDQGELPPVPTFDR